MNRKSLCVMTTVLLFLIAVPSFHSHCFSAEEPNTLTEAERRSGWKLLFDGTSTRGWRSYRAPTIRGGWTIEEGTLLGMGQNSGDLVTQEQFEFFELSIEYRIAAGGNSGVMFHVTEESEKSWHSGPEVQIQDNQVTDATEKSGWLYQLYQPVKPDWAVAVEKQAGIKTPDVDDATRPAGEWNQLYLRVSPLQSEVAVNGISYYYFNKGDEDWNQRVARSKFAEFANFGKATKGHIALQDHGDEVAFRNIKIRTMNSDGSVPDPIDGQLSIKAVEAFPQIEWADWHGVDQRGLVKEHRPIVLTHANDSSNRVFVASQIGLIHVFENDTGTKQSSVFLDLRRKTHDWALNNEHGLLGLAFHPDYQQNGQFFVYYSPSATPRHCFVSRFNVSADDPNRADPSSEQVVLKIPQPFSNHNGGSITFGKDGYLYVALGDGGGRNDPLTAGQDLTSWMGKVLRIDVNRSEGGRSYAIPPDNPFLDRDDARPEIFAYGFRNIWRMAVDRETGSIWCGDVGQDLWEEIDILEPGGNYGWSRREGTHAFGNGLKQGPSEPIDPIWEYDHQIGKSITGGFVYRGERVPSLVGCYLYADYVSGKIWALKYDQTSRQVISNRAIPSSGTPVFSFGEDESGEVYFLIASPSGRTIFRFEEE